MASKQKAVPAATGSRLNLPIFALALLGVLVVVHLWIQVERGFTHGCLGFSAPTGEIAECNTVVGSDAGSVLGVSNVFLGLAFYLAIAVLRFGAAALKGATAERLRFVSLIVASFGFLYVLWLLYYQVAVISAYCVLCLISAGITTTIFALHVYEQIKKPTAVRQPLALQPYAIAAVTLVVLAGADVLFASDSAEVAPVPTVDTTLDEARPVATGPRRADAPIQGCTYDQTAPAIARFDELIEGGIYIGDEDAPVRVMKIFDPNCPHCKTLHEVLEPAIPQNTERARFYFQPHPLWDFSVPQVQALYLAHEQGKFFEMLDLQFKNQRSGGLSIDQLAEIAAALGMDPDQFRQDIRDRKYLGTILQRRQVLAEAGVRSVPRLVFEGQTMSNTQTSWSAQCIAQLVDEHYEAAGGAAADAAPSATSAGS